MDTPNLQTTENNLTKAQYIAIWKLHGANTLAAGTDSLELTRLSDPPLLALVTTDPEPFFFHIDRSTAIATQLLKGMFTPQEAGPFEEGLAAELQRVKATREKQSRKGVFLVLRGEKNIPAPNFNLRRDIENFSVCFDAIDKSEARDFFRPSIQAVITTISLSLPVNADRQIERVGEVIYLAESNNEKPIYTFSPHMGNARLSVSSPLTDVFVTDVATRISRIISDKTLARPASLLTTSLNRATDALQAFIAAWSALEIFVNATFKTTYEAQWFDVMESGAPTSAKPVFERLKIVMSDKYRLADNFLIVASVLDADSAAADYDTFRNLKAVRDSLLHALETPAHLPTEEAQKLLIKYVTLHLDHPTA